ncbi:hypothetical protein MHLNE_06900 [Moorella humiferrea]|uniref:hypothetical protein n=1 Tax=Neomoorella humiferrea TaxID=676965 RepID=UPI0030D47A91
MAGGGYNVKIDFYSDWIRFLKHQLSNFGFVIDDEVGGQEISIKYFNLQKRLVPPRPRKILIAEEFTCPPYLESGLEAIKKKIEEGQILTPHLSKKIADLDYNDALLNDWGIHHLHLGTTVDNSGFIVRTREVLFVRFDEENAYFINVMPHGTWSEQELVRVIHRNWPKSIKRFRLNGVIGTEFKLSNEDIEKLRKAGVVTLVEVEKGVVYAPIGGGYATSGVSVEVVTTSDYFSNRVRQLEKYIIDNIDQIVIKMKSINMSVSENVEFVLLLERNEAVALEKNTKVGIKLGPLVP